MVDSTSPDSSSPDLSSTGSAGTIAGISPAPSDEEAAAIVAALTMAWPRPAIVEQTTVSSTNWRFSGRWWNKPSWRRT